MRSRIAALILCCSFGVAAADAVTAGFDLKGSDPSKLLELLTIQGFRAGNYPPDLHSGRMPPDVKDEIRAGWTARKR